MQTSTSRKWPNRSGTSSEQLPIKSIGHDQLQVWQSESKGFNQFAHSPGFWIGLFYQELIWKVVLSPGFRQFPKQVLGQIRSLQGAREHKDIGPCKHPKPTSLEWRWTTRNESTGRSWFFQWMSLSQILRCFHVFFQKMPLKVLLKVLHCSRISWKICCHHAGSPVAASGCVRTSWRSLWQVPGNGTFSTKVTHVPPPNCHANLRPYPTASASTSPSVFCAWKNPRVVIRNSKPSKGELVETEWLRFLWGTRLSEKSWPF